MHGISLMGSDFIDFTCVPFNAGNKFSLLLHPDSEELSDKFFNRLSAGGTIIVPLSKAPWDAYFGMLVDKYRIKWMINPRPE